MSGKWTPGPWEVEPEGDDRSICISHRGWLTVCALNAVTIHGILHRYGGEKGEHNARLIAQSPALFAALAELYSDARELLVEAARTPDREAMSADELEERGFAPDSFAKARAALAKAMGEGA